MSCIACELYLSKAVFERVVNELSDVAKNSKFEIKTSEFRKKESGIDEQQGIVPIIL